jgi:EAL domain-containing protein (putative c-di-GMP-specific phosphodiesterase class I)
MVEAIGKVGRALGIATVAECVETEAVLTELKNIGVDYAQGFYLATPLPISQLPP